MNKKFILPIALALMLTACPKVPDPVPDPEKYTVNFVNYDSTVLQSKEYEKGEMPVYYGETPTKPEDADYTYDFSGWDKEIVTVTEDTTYTATYTSTEKSKVEDLGVKTIAEVKELCKTVTDVNQANIGVDMTRKVTIKGIAIHKVDLVASAAKYGYNQLSPFKIIFGDSSGFIGVSSPSANNGTCLWDKCQAYVGKDTTKYEITGYLSVYMGVPELYVPGKTWTWNENLDVSFDPTKYSITKDSISSLYDAACATPYNVKGNAYGDIYTIKNVMCMQKEESLYHFTDGKHVVKVIDNYCKFSVGETYDLTGMLSLKNWSPAIYAMKTIVSSAKVDGFDKNNAIAKTVTDFKKITKGDEDTTSKLDSYIKNFMNVYTDNVYVNGYATGSKFHVAIGNTYYSSAFSDENSTHNVKKYIEIRNPDWTDLKYDGDSIDITYCPIGNYLFEEETIKVYYMADTEGKVDHKPSWQVDIIESDFPLTK